MSGNARIPNLIDNHIGFRLRIRRISIGKTQAEVANEINVTFQQLQKYEHGKNRISASMLFFIAKALNVDVEYFYEGYHDNAELNCLSDKVIQTE